MESSKLDQRKVDFIGFNNDFNAESGVSRVLFYESPWLPTEPDWTLP